MIQIKIMRLKLTLFHSLEIKIYIFYLNSNIKIDFEYRKGNIK